MYMSVERQGGGEELVVIILQSDFLTGGYICLLVITLSDVQSLCTCSRKAHVSTRQSL